MTSPNCYDCGSGPCYMNCGPAHRPDPNRAEPTRKALFSPWVSATADGDIMAEVNDYFGHDYILMDRRTGRILRANVGRDTNEWRHLVKAARKFKAL